MHRSIALATAVAFVAWTGGCSSPDEAPGELHLTLVQAPSEATPGSGSQPLLVKVVNEDGEGVPGVPVSWSTSSVGGKVTANADSSGLDGLAAADWTPGLLAGPQQISVTIYDEPALVITVTADALRADQIDAGTSAVCGIRGTATWCWNQYLDGGRPFRILSQVHAKALAVGYSYACVVDVAGTTYCSPAILSGSDVDYSLPVAGLPPISAISGGNSYFCGIDAVDRTPWCWSYTLEAIHVSTSLRLVSISANSSYGCGVAEDGAGWCWTQFYSPTAPLAGGHTFRQVGVGYGMACGVGMDVRFYCWNSGQEPVLMPGASPVAVGMGYIVGVMNVQSGARVFYAEPATGRLWFDQAPDFPFPVQQVSGDDTPCVIAVDTSVYCVSYESSDGPPTKWIAVPAPGTSLGTGQAR